MLNLWNDSLKSSTDFTILYGKENGEYEKITYYC